MNISQGSRKLTVNTRVRENQFLRVQDEKEQILLDSSPQKTRKESSPLPKIKSEKQPAAEGKPKSDKMISEYRNFGNGKIDLLTCRFDPEDLLIATGASDGMINIYSTQGANTEKPLTTVNGADIHTTPVTSLRWKPRGSYGMNPQILMSTCADGNVSHWYAPTGKLLSRIMEEGNQILACDYSSQGYYFATAGKDRSIRVYDDTTKTLVTTLSGGFGQYPGHSNRILAVKFHPMDPNVIISGGWDHNVYFWDVRQERSYGTIQGPTVSGDALDMKNNVLLTGSWRNQDQLELWDYSMRKKVGNVEWEHGKEVSGAYIYSCQFSKINDESIVAGCSNLNEVRSYDRLHDNVDFGKVTNMTKGVYCVDYANNSDMFSFCGGEGRVHLLQISKAPCINLNN